MQPVEVKLVDLCILPHTVIIALERVTVSSQTLLKKISKTTASLCKDFCSTIYK
jgi:hypothetical protein